MKVLESIGIFLGARLKQVYDRVVAHVGDFNNPHRVDKAQVGLDRVDNTADADKPVSHPQQAAIGEVAAGLLEHAQAGNIHKTSAEIRAEITEADIPESIARTSDLEAANEKLTSLLDAETARAKEAEQVIDGGKVDKEPGKGLSSNDYTDSEKNKLGNIGRYLAYTYAGMSEEEGIRQQVLKANQIDPATGKVTVVDTLLKKADVETNGLLTAAGFVQLEGLKRDGVSLDASGTPSASWHIGTPSGVMAKNSDGVLEVRNAADSAYGDMVVNGLTVKGDLVVDGDSFVVNSQTVETADNLILLNRGEVGAGVTKGVAGLEIDRGSADNYKIVFDESDDRFKAGSGADLWPIMLRDREADLTDGDVLVWDAATKRAKAGKGFDVDLSKYLPLSGGNMSGNITMGPGMGILSSRGDGRPLIMQNITGTEIIIGSLGNDLITMYTSGNNLIHGVLDGSSIISYTIWDEGNHGHGSGLDADLLDGRHGSEYAVKTDLLSLGETSQTAYRGDRGKVAYDYAVASRTIGEVSGLQGVLDGKVNTNDSRLSDARPANGGMADAANRLYITSDRPIWGNGLLMNQGSDYSDSPIGTKWFNYLRMLHGNSGGYFNEIAFPFTGDDEHPFCRRMVSGELSEWKKLAFISDIPTSLPANGGNAESANYLGRTYFEQCPVNFSYGQVTPSGIKLKLPVTTNSNKMLVFTVRLYRNYDTHDVQISGYLYNTINQWYLPKAIMIAGSSSVTVRFGRDTDGKAYVWFSGGSNYTGAAVLDVVEGYAHTSSLRSGWSFTFDNDCPNLAYENTLYPNATINQIPTSLPANGGNADTVDGLHAASPGVVDYGKLVTYNPQGYVRAAIFGDTYPPETLPISVIMFKTTNDPFLRNCPLSHLKNSLGSMPANGGTSDYALNLKVAGVNTSWNWAGQAGQPAWLWGGDSPNTMNVYNPSNFTVLAATKLHTPRTINGVSFDGTSNITVNAPASDVYAWAKAVNKPTYTHAEVGAINNASNKIQSYGSVEDETGLRMIAPSGVYNGFFGCYNDNTYIYNPGTGGQYLRIWNDGRLTFREKNVAITEDLPTVTVSSTAPANPKKGDIWVQP